MRPALETTEDGAALVEGFRVDLTALTHASEGVRDTIDSMNRRRVRDIDCPADAFGHDRLAATVADFCEHWDQGVSDLTEDVKEISARLAQCVQVYRHTDEAAQVHFEGIVLRASGGDPAAQ
ncbi:hypothetical protein [Saccharopolyspora phatthalungensis]|uniref:Excreted virulence factor EspC (Type VII ESX diderm) n=1 Tax=Saccharopolyspora phatthalungensis TaxID=664693 RepID=A0A840QF71_9PSEU|nr:hypothetical protein [Saccharopolyspora phatthalungensis]MBB5157348.1 hypothetical protein [Saccharopolyspora phatthalungensis]